MKQFIVAVMAALTLIACSTSSPDPDPSRRKARIHKAFYSVGNGFKAYKAVQVRYLDTMYRENDVLTIRDTDYIVCGDSVCTH